MPRRRHRQDALGAQVQRLPHRHRQRAASAGPTWPAIPRPATSTPTARRACSSASTRTARSLWQHSLTEEYGRVSGYGGRSSARSSTSDLVIVGMVNAQLGRPGPRRQPLRRLRQEDRRGRLVGRAGRPAQGHLLLRRRSSRSSTASGCSSPAAATAASTPSRSAPARRSGATRSAPAPSTARRSSTATSSTSATARRTPTATSQGRVICLDAGKVDKDGKPKLVWEDGRHQGRLRLADRPRRPALRLRRDRPSCYCLDAKTGKQIWEYQLRPATPAARRSGPTARSTSAR